MSFVKLNTNLDELILLLQKQLKLFRGAELGLGNSNLYTMVQYWSPLVRDTHRTARRQSVIDKFDAWMTEKHTAIETPQPLAPTVRAAYSYAYFWQVLVSAKAALNTQLNRYRDGSYESQEELVEGIALWYNGLSITFSDLKKLSLSESLLEKHKFPLTVAYQVFTTQLERFMKSLSSNDFTETCALSLAEDWLRPRSFSQKLSKETERKLKSFKQQLQRNNNAALKTYLGYEPRLPQRVVLDNLVYLLSTSKGRAALPLTTVDAIAHYAQVINHRDNSDSTEQLSRLFEACLSRHKLLRLEGAYPALLQLKTDCEEKKQQVNRWLRTNFFTRFFSFNHPSNFISGTDIALLLRESPTQRAIDSVFKKRSGFFNGVDLRARLNGKALFSLVCSQHKTLVNSVLTDTDLEAKLEQYCTAMQRAFHAGTSFPVNPRDLSTFLLQGDNLERFPDLITEAPTSVLDAMISNGIPSIERLLPLLLQAKHLSASAVMKVYAYDNASYITDEHVHDPAFIDTITGQSDDRECYEFLKALVTSIERSGESNSSKHGRLLEQLVQNTRFLTKALSKLPPPETESDLLNNPVFMEQVIACPHAFMGVVIPEPLTTHSDTAFSQPARLERYVQLVLHCLNKSSSIDTQNVLLARFLKQNASNKLLLTQFNLALKDSVRLTETKRDACRKLLREASRELNHSKSLRRSHSRQSRGSRSMPTARSESERYTVSHTALMDEGSCTTPNTVLNTVSKHVIRSRSIGAR